MLPAYFADAKFWRVLFRIDEDLAAEVQVLGCAYCGASLHSARYPRKPRGVASALLGEDYEYRLSLCCAREGCRRRATPASVRFLGRRVYLGALVVLVGVLSQGLTVKRRSQLCQQLRLSERTVLRWRQWWREVFPDTPWWRTARGRFVPALDVAQLPGALLERFIAAEPDQRLRDVLAFLAPLSIAPERAR